MVRFQKTLSILVKGQVQGVGFRPFVYRQAKRLGLKGQVKNTKHGVLIQCQGKNVQKLVDILQTSPPPLSIITDFSIKTTYRSPFKNFVIKKSIENGERSGLVQIMPDLAVCSDCIADFEHSKNRRYFYPFTNCTQCGPRYSIIYTLPYDRPRTTMKTFKMCSECLEEYNNPGDRRFHAQPNACPVCGPWLSLVDTKGKLLKTANQNILFKAREILNQGNILAIRSIGGFLLACDAKSNRAVKKLRKRKQRPYKPFAIMCRDLKTIKKICCVNNEEIKLLKSKLAPIVLLKKKKADINIGLSRWIAPNNGYLGVMLPYTPLHKLLFNVSRETLNDAAKIQRPEFDTLIMTSANPKGAPIVANSNQIKTKLPGVIDYLLDHNRPIESRCDDSIVFYCKGPVIIRYSRGFVPQPVYLPKINLKPVLAFGSDLKNSFAIGQGNKIYLSPYIGDLISEDSISFLFEMLEKYKRWFGIKPEIVACDLHPDYISSRLAEEFARFHKIPLIKVQHHYAHLVGVMAERGLKDSVVGVGYDGTGYGTDGAIWGSEILLLDFTGFSRIAHLKYMSLNGGDTAITNPKLIADTYLLEGQKSKVKGKKFLLTSSMGRLFDAASSILELCQNQTFEGQAPIALESEAMKAENSKIEFQIPHKDFFVDGLINTNLILQEIIDQKNNKTPIPKIALHFHKRIVLLTIQACLKARKTYGIKTVCLSGGVFQNRIVLSEMLSGLTRAGFKVYINRVVPINDGGIAFGQAVLVGISEK